MSPGLYPYQVRGFLYLVRKTASTHCAWAVFWQYRVVTVFRYSDNINTVTTRYCDYSKNHPSLPQSYKNVYKRLWEWTKTSIKTHTITYLLDFSGHDLICKSRNVTDNKISLIPGRVVPQIFLKESVHKLQLILPELIGAEDPLAMGPGMVILGIYPQDAGSEG